MSISLESEAESFYDHLFSDTTIEVGKYLSKQEREAKQLTNVKVIIHIPLFSVLSCISIVF